MPDPDAATVLDGLMEDASVALKRGDYLSCEAGCLRALAVAKEQQWWAYYRRILFPLQEARRHRRTIAAEGNLLLGCDEGIRSRGIDDILAHCPACVVLTRPVTLAEAAQLVARASEQRLFLEVLYADVIEPSQMFSTSFSDGAGWALSAVSWLQTPRNGLQGCNEGKALEWLKVKVQAPPEFWCKKWISAGQSLPFSERQSHIQTPAGWFLEAMELVGNAALEGIRSQGSFLQQLNDLERCLAVFADHELMHQHWIWVAQQLMHQTPASNTGLSK